MHPQRSLQPRPTPIESPGTVDVLGIPLALTDYARTLTCEERGVVTEEINRSRADTVWVGIGVPKQEKWMAEMRPLLEAPLLIGVGAAFDFHAGLVPQAPNLIQEAGLEWAYRLAHEP